MDAAKVGSLIYKLRKEKGMTQKELGNAMNVSDRTISKWERGAGMPDVSLLRDLSDLLGVDIGRILSGDLAPNENNGGNMRKIQFYVCPGCGNILFSTGKAEISCCGRKLTPLETQSGDENHSARIEQIDGESYITLNHEMSKEHYISFVAYVGSDRVQLVKLYPEQDAALRLPSLRRGKLYACCSRHGLWEIVN